MLNASAGVTGVKVKKLIREGLGWYGTSAIVGAYALSSFGLVEVESFVYLFLNITGSMGIIFISLHKKNWQPAVLNLFWIAIGITSLIRILL